MKKLAIRLFDGFSSWRRHRYISRSGTVLPEKFEWNGGRITDGKNLVLGEYVYVGENANLNARGGIKIGDGTIASSNFTIHSSNHKYENEGTIPYGFGVTERAVLIGRACWFGDSVLVLPGTTVGDFCIVGAGSVLRGDYSEGSVIIGNPAKTVSIRKDLEHCEKALKANKFYLKEKYES